MPGFLDNIARFFQCFKKEDQERDEFNTLVGKIDDELTDAFHSQVDEYRTKADRFIDKWLDGDNRRECKSLLQDFEDEINDCFNEARDFTHDTLDYEPPSRFERFCGRVEQLFEDLFGD